MKSIRYSVAVLALLAAVSMQPATSHALTVVDTGTVNKIGGAIFNPTTEERAVRNLEETIAQKQRAREKLKAQLAASYLTGGVSNQIGDVQRNADALRRALFEQGQTMTAAEYQATLNNFNRAQSRLVSLNREATWAKNRQEQLLREIERKDQDIANLEGRLLVARPLAEKSRGDVLVDTVTDIALDKAREVERTERNRSYALAREAQRDSERRVSTGYVYENIQRKTGTATTAASPYSRASGTGRDRQGGGGSSDYALDFGSGGNQKP